MNTFRSGFLVLVLFVLSFAGSDSTASYYVEGIYNPNKVVAQQAPFGYMKNVDLSSTDWTATAGTTIQFVFVGKAGIIKIATWTDTAAWDVPAGFFIPVMARRIFRTGTNADSIVVMGKR